MRDTDQFSLFSKTTLKICQTFIKEPTQELPILQISKKTGTTYSHLYNVVQKLTQAGLITVEKKGNASLCSINFNNETNLLLFSLTSRLMTERVLSRRTTLRKSLDEFTSRLRERLGDKLQSIVLFGSWAKDAQIEKSDIDVLVILSSVSKRTDESVQAEAQGIEFRYGSKVIPITITDKEFLGMLKTPKNNVVKEAARSGLVLDGACRFWSLVFEVVR